MPVLLEFFMISICRYVRASVFAVASVMACMWLVHGTAHADNAHKVDFKTAYEAAQVAEGVYEGRSLILGQLLKLGLQGFIDTPADIDVQYGVVYDHKRKIQVIAVRGTVSRLNWKLNLDTTITWDDKAGIYMHRGFLRSAREIYGDVKGQLRRGYKTFLTGHSLGGAVAAILGIYLQKDGENVVRIYTFGQPKFTDIEGSRKYWNLPIIRFMYQNDAVVLVPDEADEKSQIYSHIGPSVNLLTGPYYVYIPEEEAVQLSRNSLSRFFGLISVRDHFMKWYLRGLREKLKTSIEVDFADREKYVVRHLPGYVEPWQRKYNFNLPPQTAAR